MPRGGARTGGGKRKGQWDRKTLEAELNAARQQLVQHQDRQSKGHKLAIEVLNDIMHAAYGTMAKHQPAVAGQAPVPGADPNEAKFIDWMRMTKEVAAELAPFQSSKLKSVALTVEAVPGGTLQAPGIVRAMTAQEAYRALRDSAELIELRPVMQIEKPKKAERG